MFRTNDGGNTWRLQASDISNNINGVVFADDYTGAIVGASGLIMVTHDGGNNFFSPGTITDREMHGVAWKDNMNGIVTGNQRTYRTTDGGLNWTQVNNSDFTVYYKAF